MKSLAFYDLDGTLLDSLHRFKLLEGEEKIDLDHWRDHEHLAHLDAGIPDMVARFHKDMANPEVITAISTNRYFCDNTRQVLKDLGIEPDFISCRQNDQQSSASIKHLFMRELMTELQIFKAVFFDDNLKVLKAVKAHFKKWANHDMTTIHRPSKQGF